MLEAALGDLTVEGLMHQLNALKDIIYVYTYMYIHIKRERERDIDRYIDSWPDAPAQRPEGEAIESRSEQKHK